jgi:hypothetical protein
MDLPGSDDAVLEDAPAHVLEKGEAVFGSCADASERPDPFEWGFGRGG